MIRFDKLVEVNNLKEKEVLFDIETTGINMNKDRVFLIGYINGKTKMFTQLFSEDKEDLEILKTFKEETASFNYVTYNGRTFDFPFINKRLRAQNQGPLEIKEEYDLYYDVRVNKRIVGIKHHKLTYLEEFFNIKRNEDVESKDIPDLYKDFLDNTNDYKKLLLHNREDVLNTEKLLFLRDKIREEKIITKNSLRGRILDIDFDKDFLNISIEMDSPFNMPIHYEEINQGIRWKDNKLKIYIRTIDAKSNGANIKIYLSTIGKIKDKSTLKLDKNLVALSIDNFYIMENIRNLINLIIDYFIKIA